MKLTVGAPDEHAAQSTTRPGEHPEGRSKADRVHRRRALEINVAEYSPLAPVSGRLGSSAVVGSRSAESLPGRR